MKKYLLILLLFGCKKDTVETPPQPTPVNVCKTCTTGGFITVSGGSGHYTTIIPEQKHSYCKGEWVGKTGTQDTTIINYNTSTHKYDTTRYVNYMNCQ